MKKVRLMLSAIAVLAVVGGALAFKAKTAYTTFVYTGTTSTSCPTLLEDYEITDIGTGSKVWATFATGNKTVCTSSYTVPND